MRYTVSIGYRRTNVDTGEQARLDYGLSHGVVVDEAGELHVVALSLPEAEVDPFVADLYSLLPMFGAPEELLTFLHRKDSTITPYGRPTTLTAQSPREAVEKLAAKETR